MALSDVKLKALKPKGKTYIVTDDRGLYIEVLPTGGMVWRYRYSLNGKQEKVTIGKYPTISLKAARQKRDEMAVQVAHGESPAKQKRLAKEERAAAYTVREFGEEYYREVVIKDRKDPVKVRRYLNKEIYPAIGDRLMREVTVTDLEAMVNLKKLHGHESAAGEIRNLVKRLFDYALVRRAADHNPASALPMRFITRARARTRVLSPDEIRIFLHTIYQSSLRRQFKLALNLILLTLVRKSELLKARWADVNFETGEWAIPSENSKTGAPHIVYLSSQATDLFQELKLLAGGYDLVLPGRNDPRRPFAHNALNEALRPIHFPMAPFTIHDLRRTAATHLHEAGFPSDVVEKALNHAIGGVRGVYNRAQYADQRREMLQFWADYVNDLASEKKVILGRFARTA